MHRSALRFVLVAFLLAAVLAPASVAASQPAAGSSGAFASLTSPGESLARLWAWVTDLLPGHRPDLAPAPKRRVVGSPGSNLLPTDGPGADPYG
jgi:hypothetical protein